MLLIDDEPESFQLFCRALRRAKIPNPVFHASGGEAALRYLDGCINGVERWPCAVFLDIRMPVLNGFDVLTWIRNREILNQFVLVMMSSSSEPEDVSRAFTAGAHHYIAKDTGIDVVAKLIAEAMQFATFRERSLPKISSPAV